VPVALGCDGCSDRGVVGSVQRATHSFAGELTVITTKTTRSDRPDHARMAPPQRAGLSPITYETDHLGDAFLGDLPIRWASSVHKSFTSVT
jgi:hypothetical protein